MISEERCHEILTKVADRVDYGFISTRDMYRALFYHVISGDNSHMMVFHLQDFIDTTSHNQLLLETCADFGFDAHHTYTGTDIVTRNDFKVIFYYNRGRISNIGIAHADGFDIRFDFRANMIHVFHENGRFIIQRDMTVDKITGTIGS